ncbi:MAG: biotin/lipoyl-containing protein [Nannocystaceae bacterium]
MTDRKSFAVEVDGHAHAAAVTLADDGGAQVEVDGEVFEVRAAPDGAVLVRAADRQHLVSPDPQPRPTHATLAGCGHTLTIRTAQEAALAAALSAGAGAGAGASKITAPMPGRVVKILVAAGEAVEQGAPVIIVEAMKMENEMYAPGAGVVRTIAVAEGDTVDGGQLLCEFDLNA